MTDEATYRQIDKVVDRALEDAGLKEPPFMIKDLLKYLEVKWDFYDLEDVRLLRRFWSLQTLQYLLQNKNGPRSTMQFIQFLNGTALIFSETQLRLLFRFPRNARRRGQLWRISFKKKLLILALNGRASSYSKRGTRNLTLQQYVAMCSLVMIFQW